MLEKSLRFYRLIISLSFFLIFFIPLVVLAQHKHPMEMSSMPSSTATQKTLQNISSNNKIVVRKIGIKNKRAYIPRGSERIVDLVVGYKMVNYAGQWQRAIAVNGQIPAPILHFKEGDHVTINVYNHLDQPTSIHWHGIFVPWQMDGVENVSQRGIPPGCVFHYQFTLYQSGTYWYHAHAGLQEQEGLYGAFIVDPPQPPAYHYTKDYVAILSDWSNTSADQVFANLKKDGDYYSQRFPLQPSLMKFIHDYRKAYPEERKKLMGDYKSMQQMRMSIYDLSDVAYDAFLLNGHSCNCPWKAPVQVGDVVRLRFIGAAGSTIYRVKIPGTKMEMVHVDGNDVQPYFVDDFTIAPGETFDVLVKIERDSPYIIYAESWDTLGAAYGALITNPNQFVNYRQVMPFPEPKPVTREMMENMMSMDHSSMNMQSSNMNMKSSPMKEMSNMNSSSHQMQMSSSKNPMTENQSKMPDSMKMNGMNMNHAMNMPTEPTIIGDKICLPNSSQVMTMGTKYQNLTAAVKTNDPNIPVAGIIKMELFGYMDRFIWFINGLPEYKAHPIIIEPGKRYRIIFTNNSMMHHPMHIHGHWFILRNGHGEYDPLLHTIDVAPGATVVVDIDTDASGQWFFHCHHIYHMAAGMARVFQYSTLIEIAKGCAKPQDYTAITSFVNRPIVRVDEQVPIDPSLVDHPIGHHAGFFLSNYLDVGEDPFHNVQELTFKGLYGGDYNKLELFTNDAELNQGKIENADLDIFYWHLINQFWAIKAGANYFYRPTETPYWQPGVGIEGLMPYFIDTNVRSYYHSGSAKLDVDLSRDTQITNNFFLRTEIRSILATKTATPDEIGNGLNQMRYAIRPYYRIMPGLNAFVEYEHDQDYGAFKMIQKNEGEDTRENTITLGLSYLF